MTEQEIYRKAKKRVKAKKNFFIHFGVFSATVALLFTINYITFHEAHIWWAFIPSVAWGIAIVAHYISVFGVGIVGKLLNSFGYDAPEDNDWEANEMKKEMEKIKRQNYNKSIDDNITVPDDKLELKEFKKLRDEWDDRDFV